MCTFILKQQGGGNFYILSDNFRRLGDIFFIVFYFFSFKVGKLMSLPVLMSHPMLLENW